MPPQDLIAAFCHIPKTGGMTFHDLLRRYFGAGHLICIPGREWTYQPEDLRRDLKWNSRLRSIGGHGLCPWVDFGDYRNRLEWYTILRDPLARSISNYQHQVEKRGQSRDFNSWLELPHNHNWQVQALAGRQDLEEAKRVLTETIKCFGFIEQYHEFLLLLRDRLHWEGFNLRYDQPRNPSKSGDVRRKIKAEMPLFADNLQAANKLDLALVDYARKELYPKQIAEYGLERMAKDLDSEFSPADESVREKFNRALSLGYEKGLYGPLMKAVRYQDRSG